MPTISVRPDRNAIQARKLVSEWPKRTKGLVRFVAHWAAKRAYDNIQQKVPSGPEWAAYRESLKLASVKGDLEGASAFTVLADPKAREVREVDGPKVLLYIRSRRRLKRVKPEIEILEKYSPWTLQTLPFSPKRSDAQVISRTVTEREVKKVTKARMRDRKQWRFELLRAGSPVSKDRVPDTRPPQATPDVAFEAMRLEFGLGVKAAPHWRPAISDVVRAGVTSLQQDPAIQAAFTKPSFTDWQSWEKIDTTTSISSGDARKFLPFQEKLGIRSKR